MNITMDSKDLRILTLLQQNGRMPISELATKLNMSDTPCLRRVKKMEESGVISGYSANISADSIGFNAIVYVFVRLTENSNANADMFEYRSNFGMISRSDFLNLNCFMFLQKNK